MQGLAWQEARRWRSCRTHLDDLFQEIMLWVCKAADRFDPKRGFTFTTFASYYIKGASRAHVAAGCLSPVSAGRGRAERAGLWKGEFRYPTAVSVDAPLVRGDPDGSRLHDVLADGAPGPEEQVADEDSRAKLRARVRTMLGRLDPRERAIIERRLMQDKDDVSTLLELGADLGGTGGKRTLSRERVRQLETRAIVKLRRFLRS